MYTHTWNPLEELAPNKETVCATQKSNFTSLFLGSQSIVYTVEIILACQRTG